MNDDGPDRRENLEQELGAARAGLARAQGNDETTRLQSVVRELEQQLERVILAIEIERQSDA